jgi:hypothetical protein
MIHLGLIWLLGGTIEYHLDPITPYGYVEGLIELLQGKPVGNDRPHIHGTAFYKADGARIGVLHPADDGNSQSFPARGVRRKCSPVFGWDANEHNSAAWADGGDGCLYSVILSRGFKGYIDSPAPGCCQHFCIFLAAFG